MLDNTSALIRDGGAILIVDDNAWTRRNTLLAKCFCDALLVLSQDFVNVSIMISIMMQFHGFAWLFDLHAQDCFHKAAACDLKIPLLKLQELVAEFHRLGHAY
jgi:hypothetical protein